MKRYLLLQSAVLTALILLLSFTTSAIAQTGPVILEHSVEFTAAELGTWGQDRAEPDDWGHTPNFDGRTDLLEITINGDEVDANTFARTEGVKKEFLGYTVVETELYLDSNWQNHPVRAGLWVEGVNSAGDGYDSWGIIEFVTGSNYGPSSNATTNTGFRIWDSVGSGVWDESSIDPSGLWDTWVSLRVELNTDDGRYDYYINDTLVGSFVWDSGEDITQTGDIIFNHYDYNHGSEEGSLESGYSVESYTAHWDDLTLKQSFDMIQPAVDAASDGDMIDVAASGGPYAPFGTSFGGPANVTIQTTDDAEIALGDPAPANRIVDFRADGTTFQGFTITGGTNGDDHTGISVSGQGLTVSGNEIDGVQTGIQTTTQYTEGNNEIIGNTITNSDVGISLQNNTNELTGNTIDVAVEGFGIGSSSNTITGNDLTIGNGGNQLQTYSGGSLPGGSVDIPTILTNNTFNRAVVVTDGSVPTVQTIFGGIQNAVTDASSGDIVEVHPGSYETTDQVLIDKELTIEGVGSTKPVISPDGDVTGGDPTQAWFLAEASTDFILNNVELNGNGHFIHYGIRSHGNTTIEEVDFMEIQGSASGNPYHGIAVSSFGGMVDGGGGSNSHGSGGAASHLIVNNSTFSQIGRIGMLVKGDESTAEITNNMYTGKGNGDFLDYMVDLGAGGQANITGNTISDNRGVASSDGSTSAGILVTTFWGSGTIATIEENTIEDNTTGIAVGYDGSDGSDVTAQNNNFSGNGAGVTSTNPQVDARYNNWGDVSGPSGGVADPESGVLANGTGDEVGANVRFHPWLGDSPASVELAIGEQPGWRMMGAPVTGVTVADLAAQNLVQGITGLPFDGFDANVLLWDPNAGTAGEYVAPTNGSSLLNPGTGFFWYMWGPDSPDLPESYEFPVTISLVGDPETGDVSLGTLSTGWNLIANPFAEDIDFTLLENGLGSSLGETGSVWDPNAGGTGSYVLTSSVTLNDKLSVWQGAFIELDSETEVVVPEDATTTGAEFLKGQELLTGQIEFVLEGLDNKDNVQTRDLAAQLYFHENASNGWDGYDVSKLTPFSQEYATIAFVGQKNNDLILKAQHALPYNVEHSQEIPLEFQMSGQLSENGSSSFQLSWPVAKDLPEHVEVWLSDQETGQKYNLREVGSIEFTDDALQVVKRPSIQSKTIAPRAKEMAVTGAKPRFVVSIIAEGEEKTVLPQKISLNQNYPNPFNPATQISYELPETANVRLEVFDLIGRQVATLVDEQVAAGTHQVNFDAGNLSSGVYLYRLQTANVIFTKKLTLIK